MVWVWHSCRGVEVGKHFSFLIKVIQWVIGSLVVCIYLFSLGGVGNRQNKLTDTRTSQLVDLVIDLWSMLQIIQFSLFPMICRDQRYINPARTRTNCFCPASHVPRTPPNKWTWLPWLIAPLYQNSQTRGTNMTTLFVQHLGKKINMCSHDISYLPYMPFKPFCNLVLWTKALVVHI